MITLYTHSRSPFALEYWKAVARSVTGKYSGPQAVRDSLVRGLALHEVPYALNPRRPPYDTAFVLSGVEALKAALLQKHAGAIRTLLAGPNLVTTPHDAGGILLDPQIDWVIVPSQWVSDAYAARAPALKKRLFVWPAGVAEAEPSTRRGSVIIYYKGTDPYERDAMVDAVRRSGHTVTLFEYGSYRHQDYLQALTTATAMVFVSPSESQGLALQEAWMRDVPTFVHYTGRTATPAFEWRDDHINAPYLADTCGAFFRDVPELITNLARAADYHPRPYCQAKLSDRASATRIINLITTRSTS